MENNNQDCDLGWLAESQKKNNDEEIFNRALVIGGHNESLTPTFICKVNDYIEWRVPSRGYNIFLIHLSILKFPFYRVIGQYNREEEVCYIPVGDKVYPFSGYGIQLLLNHKNIVK